MPCHWTIEAAGASHPGQREYNEDSWLADADDGCFIVADGVGGRDAGEVASRIACEVTAAHVRAGDAPGPALKAANSAILEAIQISGEQASSMASTAVVLYLEPDADAFSVAWAGDSRLYLWEGDLREGELKSLTRDHSLVESMIRRGEITRDEADTHRRKNVILQALGDTRGELTPGENRGGLPQTGLFLLCSDGLSDILDADALCGILSRDTDSLQVRADDLVQTAVDAGGRDNITALLVSCQYTGESPQAQNTAKGPVVYESYDPVSGERRRDLAVDRAAPTIRWVPARSEVTGSLGDNADGASPQALSGRPASPRRWRWRWWLAAVALLAGVLLVVDLVSRQGL